MFWQSVIVARRMISLLRGQRQTHSPSAGTAESQMPSPLTLGIGRAATLLKTLLQYYGKSLEALPGVVYPGFRDNCSTLNTKTGYIKKNCFLKTKPLGYITSIVWCHSQARVNWKDCDRKNT